MSLLKLSALALGLLLIFSFALPNVYASYHMSKASVKISTDKASYNLGDEVLVSVTVRPVKTDTEIQISIFDPKDLFTEVKKFAGKDGAASHTFTLPDDALTGTWKVTASFMDAKGEATFPVSKAKTATTTTKDPSPTPLPSPASIRISSDKASYAIGDTALIMAIVEPVTKETVSISILGSDGRTYLNEKLLPNEKGVVEVEFSIGKGYPLGEWTVAGTYGDVSEKAFFQVIQVEKEEEAVKEKPTPTPSPVSPAASIKIQLDKTSYTVGETAVLVSFVEGDPDRPYVVGQLWGPDGQTYFKDEIRPDKSGIVEFKFAIEKNYPPGKWTVVCSYGDASAKLSFKVVEVEVEEEIEKVEKEEKEEEEVTKEVQPPKVGPEVTKEPDISAEKMTQGEAAIKNLKRMTLMSVKNTGDSVLSSIFISVDQGSIPFVKARYWERERVADNVISLTSSKALQPGDHMMVLLIWKDRAEFNRIKVPLMPIEKPTDIEPMDGPANINIFFVAEKIQRSADVNIEITETISVSDMEHATPPVEIAITETISVSDLGSTAPAIQIQITETVSISDSTGVT